MLADEELRSIRESCRSVLTENWREGARESDDVPFAYTCPSPGHYPFQWYWDSCFTAIAWRHVDPDRGRRELESLLAAQREDGFIGHTIFWNARLAGWRRLSYNVVTPDAAMTSSIQPPVLAWAWSVAVGDPSSEAGIVKHHEWLSDNRDLDGDGLIWIVQPDESGLDASPQFDAIWGRRAHGRAGFTELVWRNRRLGFDLRRVDAAGGPVVCEVMTNVLWCLSRLAVGQSSITQRLLERMYDERRGVFTTVAQPIPEREPAVTWTTLAPLALPDLPADIGHRLVEDHLLSTDRFWTAFPPPSVPINEPSFSLHDRGTFGVRRYWRGPTWINSAWIVWLGLLRLGYDEQAAELQTRLGRAILASGLREYYDPFTGRGMGAIDFGWSTLMLEMLSEDPRAALSYVPAVL